MKILAVIAARAGSKGVKNKHLKKLAGKPVIVHTIEQLIKWGKHDKFIISTDSEKIAKIGRSMGVDIPFMRPGKLAGDNIGKMDVLRHALIKSEKYYNMKFDILLDLDATSPARTVTDIDNAVKLFIKKKAGCVFSVVKAHRNPYFNMVEIMKNGKAVLCKPSTHTIKRRQDTPKVYEMNASIYVYNRAFLLDSSNKMPYSNNAYSYEMDENSRFDIDTELDFKLLEFLVKEKTVKL